MRPPGRVYDMILPVCRRLGERFAGPTQPRDHPQILAIRYILEMMAGHAVEFSKRQCLSRGIYDAHAAENWSGSTDSGVTTRVEVGRIRHLRLSLRDGWSKCRYGKRSPVNRTQRDRRVDIEIDPPARNISGPNGWVTQRRALGGVWLAHALHAEQ